MNSPAAIANLYADTGAAKTHLPLGKMFVLAIFAGAFIALGGLGSSIASFGLPGAIGRILSALVFPIGLMMVLVAGAELFTGNCLIIVSVMEKRASWLGMLRNWGVVYLGNFIGGVVIAALAVFGHTLDIFSGTDYANAVVKVAMTKVNLPFLDAFIRGILCNVMVCVAVWVSFAAADLAGKVLALCLPVFLFVLCGFEHCIANMYFIPAGIFASMEYQINASNLSWLTFLLNNLIPVTLGNIVGGSVLVGLGYWFAYYSCCRDK